MVTSVYDLVSNLLKPFMKTSVKCVAEIEVQWFMEENLERIRSITVTDMSNVVHILFVCRGWLIDLVLFIVPCRFCYMVYNNVFREDHNLFLISTHFCLFVVITHFIFWQQTTLLLCIHKSTFLLIAFHVVLTIFGKMENVKVNIE